MAEDPGSDQGLRRREPAGARHPDDDLGALGGIASSDLTDVDAAIATLRVGDGSGSTNPWLERLEHRSPNATVCPFLLSVGDDGARSRPVESPDAVNRCAALRDVVPQSLRQQQLVCLASGHVNCPRYLRGALVAAVVPRRSILRGGPLTPAVFGAILVLVASFAASVAFVVARGGMALSVTALEPGSPSPSSLAAGTSPSPVATSSLVPASPDSTVEPPPTVAPTRAPSPTPSAPPEATATPAPTPSPTPAVTASGDPILARFPELRHCPVATDCYIYVVEPGNNLVSIANYYRVSYDRVLAMNPAITNPSTIHAGDPIRMPTPQRPAP